MKINALQVLFLILPTCLLSQNTLPSKPDSTLQEIVITAQRSATDAFQTPEAMAILDYKSLQNTTPRSSPEALQNIVGVFVQKTNHGGGSPFLRGLTGNQTLILVDGVRLNNATFRFGPNQYLNTIDPLSIERIEVLHGGGSAAYGSDAVGGTIQVFTKNPVFSDKEQWRGRVFGKIWSQRMEQTVRPELGFSSKRVAFLGGVSVKKFGDLVGGDTTGRQIPSGYRELDIDLKLKTKITEGGILTTAFQNSGQIDVPIYHKIQLENFAQNQIDQQRRALAYVRFDQDFDNSFFDKTYILTAYHGQFENRSSRKNGTTLTRFERDSTHSWSLQTGFESKFGKNWQATTGFDFYTEGVQSVRIDDNNGRIEQKRGLYPNGATMQNAAVFSLHQIYLDDNWQVHFGGRWNGFLIKIADKDIGKATLKPAATVWNAALLRGLGKHFNLFIAANSAFRAPNVDDLGTLGIVDFRYELPNYDLQPERSLNYQIGGKMRFDSWRGAVYFFRNDLKNLITRVQRDTQKIANYPVFYKENVESGFIQGIETTLNGKITEGVNFAFGAAYTYGQNRTKDEPLRRIPPLNGRFALNFERKTWSISAEILAATAQTRLAAGDKADNRIPSGGTPAWQVVNLYGNWTGKNLRLSAGATNLFNQDYRTHGSGINGVGRSVWLTTTVSFGGN